MAGAHYGTYAPIGSIKDPEKKGHLIPDFRGNRVEMGIRHACYLASTGDPEGAFVTLEDTVSLIEKVMSLPNGTMLTCKSIYLEDECFELRREIWPEEGNRRPIMQLFRGKGSDEYVGAVRFEFPIAAFTSPAGWEWFDPIRSDPRFASYVERVKAAFAPEPNE